MLNRCENILKIVGTKEVVLNIKDAMNIVGDEINFNTIVPLNYPDDITERYEYWGCKGWYGEIESIVEREIKGGRYKGKYELIIKYSTEGSAPVYIIHHLYAKFISEDVRIENSFYSYGQAGEVLYENGQRIHEKLFIEHIKFGAFWRFVFKKGLRSIEDLKEMFEYTGFNEEFDLFQKCFSEGRYRNAEEIYKYVSRKYRNALRNY